MFTVVGWFWFEVSVSVCFKGGGGVVHVVSAPYTSPVITTSGKFPSEATETPYHEVENKPGDSMFMVAKYSTDIFYTHEQPRRGRSMGH